MKLLFTSKRCPPCRPMKERLRKEGVKFKEIDVDTPEGSKLADKYNVRMLPSMVIDGKLEEDLDKWFL